MEPKTVTASEVMSDLGEMLDDLTYRSYSYNRSLSPNIKPWQWARIFPDAAALEARYQQELMEHYEPSDFPRPEDYR